MTLQNCRKEVIKLYKFNKSDFEQQVKQVRDDDGNRYVKCESCGNIVSTDDCVSYGGINRVNFGLCRRCAYKKV